MPVTNIIGNCGVSGATVSWTGPGPTAGSTVADGGGNFTFPDGVAGLYVITPSLAGYSFAPQSITVMASGVTDVVGLAFVATLQIAQVQPSTGVTDLIVKRVRRLLGNSRKDSDMIIGHLEMVNEEMAGKFQSYGLRFDTRVVVIGGIPPNTTNLSALQTPNQPLFDLLVPESLDWKLAGQPEIMWRRIPNSEEVGDTNLGDGIPGDPVIASLSWPASWEWRGGKVWMSPCSLPIDARCRGQFMPQLVASDATDPLRAAIVVLTLATAISIVTTEGGPAAANAKAWMTRLVSALGDFQSNQVKAQQSKLLRLAGRRTASRNCGFAPPIE